LFAKFLTILILTIIISKSGLSVIILIYFNTKYFFKFLNIRFLIFLFFFWKLTSKFTDLQRLLKLEFIPNSCLYLFLFQILLIQNLFILVFQVFILYSSFLTILVFTFLLLFLIIIENVRQKRFLFLFGCNLFFLWLVY
jgi:hypothetical protein